MPQTEDGERQCPHSVNIYNLLGVVWQTPHSDDGEFVELELKFQNSRFPMPLEMR